MECFMECNLRADVVRAIPTMTLKVIKRKLYIAYIRVYDPEIASK